MKRLFLLVATLFSVSAATFAQEQGEDNGFGLRIHAGFYNDEKYGQIVVEEDGGLFGGLMDEAMEEADEAAGYETKNIPLLGMSIDNRWYVANPGKAGIAIDARWLDFGIAKQSASYEGEEYWKALNAQIGLLMPGVIGTFYLGNDMAIDAHYNVGATLAVRNAEYVGETADGFDELEEMGMGSFSNMVSGFLGAATGMEEGTSWGFGVSHFFGASFRYKIFQVGFEYNIAKLKTVDWFSDDKDSDNDLSFDLGDDDDDFTIDFDDEGEVFGTTTKTDKIRFNNFRVFLGFKF